MRPPLSPLRLATCFALALAPFAARLEAQGCAHQPDADPRTGPASQHPFGSHDPLDLAMANQSLVFRIDPAQLPAQRTLLTAIGFASVATRTYHFDELSIRLGHSSAPALNTTLALNFEGFTQLVMQVGDWTWSARADEWCLIGLTTPFLYDPALGQLVIQITTAGGASSGSGSPGLHSDPARPSVLQTAWRFAPGRGVIGTGVPKIRLCWDIADLQVFGAGCAGSNGLIPRLTLAGSSALGGNFTLGLRDAPPSSPWAFLIIDYRLRALPFDLGIFGATGCEVRPFWDLFFEPFALSNGGVDLPLAIPRDPSLSGGRVWCQWLPHDPSANPFAYTTSSLGRVLIGT